MEQALAGDNVTQRATDGPPLFQRIQVELQQGDTNELCPPAILVNQADVS